MDILTRYYDQDPVRQRVIDIAVADKVTRKCALFYIHGGGWTGGHREQYHEHMLHFAARGYLAASAGYRLAPAAKLQDQIADLRCGYDRFLSFIKDRKLPIERIITIGSSAGAHLASLLSLTEPGTFAPVEPTHRWLTPSACVSVCGPATVETHPDMNESIRNALVDLLGDTYEQAPERYRHASPINHINNNSPDFLFILAEHEDCFPHPFIHAMIDKLRQHGKRAQSEVFPAEHGFFYSLKTAPQKAARKTLETFLATYED